MPLELRPCVVADIPRLTQIVFDAFSSDTINLAMFPREHVEDFLPWFHRRLERLLGNPSIRSLKVVDTDLLAHPDSDSDSDREHGEAIIGYGRWQVPVDFDIPQRGGDGSQEQNKNEKKKSGEGEIINEKSFIEPPSNPLPPSANAKLFDYTIKKFTEIQAKYLRDDQDFMCQMLAVESKHQGRGAGKMMINYGIEAARQAAAAVEQADREAGRLEKSRKPVAWLEAVEGAYKMYVKWGFQDVERTTTNLEEFGAVGGVYTTVCMWYTFGET